MHSEHGQKLIIKQSWFIFSLSYGLLQQINPVCNVILSDSFFVLIYNTDKIGNKE